MTALKAVLTKEHTTLLRFFEDKVNFVKGVLD